MARRGRKRQLELETEYWRLLASGVGTVEACKALGIGRKTGYRWRAETGGLPPVRRGEAGRSGRGCPLLTGVGGVVWHVCGTTTRALHPTSGGVWHPLDLAPPDRASSWAP